MIKGSKDKSSLLRGDLLSSTDWARAPRWDLAFCAHRSSVCSRRGAAADSSTDGPQLRGQRVPHPQLQPPGTHELNICPRSLGEGRSPVLVTDPRARAARWMSPLLWFAASGNVKSHFYTVFIYRAYTTAELGCLGHSFLPGTAFHFRLRQDYQTRAFKNQDSGLKRS